jgi:hypothetical protein
MAKARKRKRRTPPRARPAKKRHATSKPRKRRKGGRPRISDAEKARRGTLKPYRARDKKPTRTGPKPVAPAKPRDYVTIARRYAADILSGRQVACRWVTLACERQDRDAMRAATDPSWPFVWSDAHAA